MFSPERAEAPIYARLVEERGDVPAEVRRTAEKTLQELSLVMDFRDLRTRAAYR